MNAPGLAGGLLLLLAAAAPLRAASRLDVMARELGGAARSAGLRLVAVSRLEAAGGAGGGEAALLTERLTTALVRSGRVQAVERSLLPKLMEERFLARGGATAEGGTDERLARVDGVVTGTYRVAGRRTRLVARVVDYRTGIIVAAAEAALDAEEEGGLLELDPFAVPLPGTFDLLAGSARDAVADPELRCAGAAGRANALEEGILELKARYWASRLKAGMPDAEVKANLRGTIPDPGLRARFHEALERRRMAGEAPPLTPSEVRSFVKVDGEAYALLRDCGL